MVSNAPEIALTVRVGQNFIRGHHCVIGDNVTIGNNVVLGNMCIIESGAVIGDGVTMGHFCIVGQDCTIGDSCVLKSQVELRKNTMIGPGCYVDSGVRSSGNNRIGACVTLRYNTIIARGCDIGDNCYLCPQVMTNNLDHNGNEVGGAHLGENCFVGTNSTIGAGLRIASRSVIGSKAMVTRDIEVAGVYVGVPAKWIRAIAAKEN